MRCAEIVDGVVTNVAVFEECPADWLEDTIGASPGWLLVDGVLSAPTAPTQAPVEHTREQIEAMRLRAYSDPLNGSDRYFAEGVRLSAMGASADEIAEANAAGAARFVAIQSEFPWPEV